MKRIPNTLSKSDRLKMRVARLKKSLPKDHTEIFMDAYPEYNTHKGLDAYRNVIYLKSANKEIIEKFVKLFQKER